MEEREDRYETPNKEIGNTTWLDALTSVKQIYL